MYDVILDMEDAMEESELLEPAPGEPVNPVGVTDPPLKPGRGNNGKAFIIVCKETHE